MKCKGLRCKCITYVPVPKCPKGYKAKKKHGKWRCVKDRDCPKTKGRRRKWRQMVWPWENYFDQKFNFQFIDLILFYNEKLKVIYVLFV